MGIILKPPLGGFKFANQRMLSAFLCGFFAFLRGFLGGLASFFLCHFISRASRMNSFARKLFSNNSCEN
ncbi:MAG: hypothetical protein A3B08_00100 [Candidatus Taylorbacteria bacterium RIFCSPLOWO2_01_FULL_43_44]|nr:MAG: hypothetical protein A2743_03190 [Candidatus Taylorbacteria bacterium RIFCSPHIGHO2_01_FULL_43_47]OHA31677.1 MAG: hypothetical protein A3B08_00100 [Candidatus Taylorbacteria bacterium RIFCSPLOWO2_01_FULL_43_44]